MIIIFNNQMFKTLNSLNSLKYEYFNFKFEVNF